MERYDTPIEPRRFEQRYLSEEESKNPQLSQIYSICSSLFTPALTSEEVRIFADLTDLFYQVYQDKKFGNNGVNIVRGDMIEVATLDRPREMIAISRVVYQDHFQYEADVFQINAGKWLHKGCNILADSSALVGSSRGFSRLWLISDQDLYFLEKNMFGIYFYRFPSII